jgi:hypothetical protein
MTMTAVYRKKDDLLVRRIAGETLIVPIRGKLADMQRIFALNPVAEFVWEQLDGKRDLDAIRAAIVAGFAVETARAEADLRELVTQLVEADLVGRVVP